MAKWREVEIKKREPSLGELLATLTFFPALLYVSTRPSYEVIYENERGEQVKGRGDTVEEARRDAERKLY